MRRFDVVSTISQSMGAKVLGKGVRRDQFVLFPDWVDTNVIFPANVAENFRVELEISESTVVVLFAGTLGAKQGIETLIAAARCLGKIGSVSAEILILICGDGQAAPMLQTLASGLTNVRFLGLQPADRLNALLNVADIHVLPQVPEVADSVLPSKLLGMLASGRPVVATVGPESEIGRLVAKCGVIVRPGDATALAHAIHEMATDLEGRAQLGFEARKKAVQLFHHESILGEFELQLKRRIARRGATSESANDMSPTA
jgi:colanic acid biosynthesis glycosyl transferase WcaI